MEACLKGARLWSREGRTSSTGACPIRCCWKLHHFNGMGTLVTHEARAPASASSMPRVEHGGSSEYPDEGVPGRTVLAMYFDTPGQHRRFP